MKAWVRYQEKLKYIRFGHFKNDYITPFLYEKVFTKNLIDWKDNTAWFL